MAGKTEPKQIDKSVMGKVTEQKTADHGDKHSGPTKYNQAKIGSQCIAHDLKFNKKNFK